MPGADGHGQGCATFVFVGKMAAITSSDAIDLAMQAERGTAEFEADLLAVLVSFEGSMELTASVDGCHAATLMRLHFLKVKKTRTICPRV